jgi:hypothetical protein
MSFNRITAHHTGGGYKPNATDLAAYPKCIDGDGQVHHGKFPLLANAVGRKLVAGAYYPHTRGLNSGNLGIALCAMASGVWANPRASKAFPRLVQIDALIDEMAKDCREFGIVPSREHTLSHAEVEPTLGVKQKQKWDFDYQIRNTAGRDPIAIFDEIRQEVTMRLRGVTIIPPRSPRPDLRQGATGGHVLALQRALGIKDDGAFGPKTRAAVVAFQRRHNLLPDGNVSRMTWAALGL